MPDLPSRLAELQGVGYVKAPAGYGKTHLIAAATAQCMGRQLVLTHTYAGVAALQRKMRLLGVSPTLYRVDTIASWCLRICLAYPIASGWTKKRPQDSSEWESLYQAAAGLLKQDFCKRIIEASYAGLYVDEYQDCSITQHQVILQLISQLPCRILGDPLQGIFDFGGQTQIDWEQDVEDHYELLGTLDTPHRWNNAGAHQIGEWLQYTRLQIEDNKAIDLSSDLPPGVILKLAGATTQDLLQKQYSACMGIHSAPTETVLAVHAGASHHKARGHALARRLGGRYTSLEEVEGRDLFSFIEKLDKAPNAAAAIKEAIAFAKKCMTAVESNLAAGTKRGELVPIRSTTRNPAVTTKANCYLTSPSSYNLRDFLQELARIPGVIIARADLYYRAISILEKHILHASISLAAAGEVYQREFRYKGRPIRRRKQIGSTLLVKGLEFDHGIVLDASTLSQKELYVAITRGSKSLTIVSTSEKINNN